MTSALARSLLYARVVSTDFARASRVSIEKYVMDPRLTMYFSEKTEEYAFDESKQCGVGDYVLIREIPAVICEEKEIKYNIEKLVYKDGYFVDPVSGKRNAGREYIDDIKRTTETFGYKRPF